MRKPSLWTGVLGAAIALTMVAGPAFAVEETKIGVTSASNLTTTGFPPVSPEHLLGIGVEVVGDERVITTKDGRAQLLFLDHSALTIGPNSNLVLDKFVYDPDAGVGELAFSATKGLFRLVGGRISKKTPVTIKTSAGTIGIRGGIAIVSIEEGGPVEATFLFGKEMTVESEGRVVTATRPGSLVTFSLGNILDPVLLSAERLGRIIEQLEQPPGKPTDSAVLVFQQKVKDAVLGALAEPAAGPSPTPPPPFLPITLDLCPGCIEDSQEEIAEPPPPPSLPPPPPPPSGTIFDSTFAGRFKTGSSADLSAGKGTTDGDPEFDIPFSNASIVGGFLTAPTPLTPLLLPTSGTPIIDVGPGFTGFSFDVTGTSSPFGPLFGEGFISDDLTFIFYETFDNGVFRDIIFAGIPATSFPTSGITAYILEPDFVLESNVPFVRGFSGGDLFVADEPLFLIDFGKGVFGGALIAIDGDGQSGNQTSAASVFGGSFNGTPTDLLGLMRGTTRVSSGEQPHFFDSDIELSRDGDGNAFFGADNPDYFVFQSDGGAVDVFEGTTTTYFPNVPAHVDPTETLGTRTTRTLNGFAGGLSQRIDSAGKVIGAFVFINTIEDGSGITIQTDAATGTLTAVFDVHEEGVGVVDGNQLVAFFGGAERSAFFDDESFGAIESGTLAQFTTVPTGPAVTGTDLYMVTSEAFESNNFPGAASECACQFLEWGFWGGEIRFEGGESERIHLANWIAGDNIASGIDLPTVGTAVYSGHLIGTVLNAGAVYQAMGGFNMNFDFAAPKASTINVTGFDAVDYNANVVNLTNGIYQATGADASALSRTIEFEGAFFGGGGDPVAETGGNFDIDGPTYQASGIFAGAK